MTRKVLVKVAGAHNVFRECFETDVNNPRNVNPRVDNNIAPLLAELSKKRPSWIFITREYGQQDADTGSGWKYSGFNIMEGEEEVGKVWIDTHWRTSERKFAYTGPRLDKKRGRGSYNMTKDLKKAVKTIIENTYAKTPEELVTAACSNAESRLSTKVSVLRRDYERSKDRLLPHMEAFMLDNIDSFKAVIPNKEWVEQLQTNKEEWVKANMVEQRAHSGDATLIVERGDKVVSTKLAKPLAPVITSLDKLPDGFKRALGVLKLAPIGTLLPDLGFRVNEDTYVAFHE